MHLVANAIMAVSNNNGNVTLASAPGECGDTVQIIVRDDGCGMDHDVKKKVFTNFFTTKGSGGTGLGLLTTKKIVHEHGGRIDLESEAGKGTVFRIQLPRDRLPEAAE